MTLEERMKTYETVSKSFLVTRMPIVVRIDGRAFHSFCRQLGLEKPFDRDFMVTMGHTAKELVHEVQGCQIAYTQSDEINLLIIGYKTHESQPWFNGNRDKIISVGASFATVCWIRAWAAQLDTPYQINEEYYPLPTFDARAFNIPENDVANYFLWRAKDNYRNSIQSFAQAHFSHKQLHGKSLSDIHEMLHDKGLNWATDCTPREKNGCWYSRQGGFNTGVRSSYVSVSTYLDRVVVYEVEKKEKRSLPF